jgi:hypothetical protein
MADRGCAAAAWERLIVFASVFVLIVVVAAVVVVVALARADAGAAAEPAIDEPQPARTTPATAAQGRAVRWRSLMAWMVIQRRLNAVGSRLRLR